MRRVTRLPDSAFSEWWRMEGGTRSDYMQQKRGVVIAEKRRIEIPLAIALDQSRPLAVRCAAFSPGPNWEIHSCTGAALQFTTPDRNLRPNDVCEDGDMVWWKTEDGQFQEARSNAVTIVRDGVGVPRVITRVR